MAKRAVLVVMLSLWGCGSEKRVVASPAIAQTGASAAWRTPGVATFETQTGSPPTPSSSPVARAHDAPVTLGSYSSLGAIAAHDGSIYLLGYGPSNGAILRVPEDATGGIVDLWIPMEDPAHIVPTRFGVFYNDVDTHAVWRIPLAGGKPMAVGEADDESLGGDATGAFFTHDDQLFEVEAGRASHLISGVGSARAMVADKEAARWMRDDMHVIQRFDRKRKTLRDLATISAVAQNLSVCGPLVFYSDGGSVEVVDERDEPPAPKPLFTDPAVLIAGLTVDEGFVYATFVASAGSTPAARIVRIKRDSGAVELLSSDVSRPDSLTDDGANLYFIDKAGSASTLMRLSKSPAP